MQSTTTHAVLMRAVVRAAAAHVGQQEMREQQHDRDTIGPLSYPNFAELFKAFIECELAVTTAQNHSPPKTVNVNGDGGDTIHYMDASSLELQEPDATNYYGHCQKNHYDNTATIKEDIVELLQEECMIGIRTAQANPKSNTSDNKKKVSFCTFSAVTPAVDKLTHSHYHRQRCILALSELLNQATRLVQNSRSYLWNEFVPSRMTHALEQLIGGLDTLLVIDGIRHEPNTEKYETRGMDGGEHMNNPQQSHSQSHSRSARHKHGSVARRLRTEFQGILEACLRPGHASARTPLVTITADDQQPPQSLVLCPMAHVQLGILLSAQIRFHLRR
jgi:hypothetical protein